MFESGEQCLRDWMRWATQAYRILTASHYRRYLRGTWKNQGERTRPEGINQLSCLRRHCTRPALKIRITRNMHNQRMISRPAFRRKNSTHCVRIFCIGTESVDRFGGKCDELAFFQQSCGRKYAY
jgi:hypothetical protein